MNREAIYSALFSTIQGIAITAGVKTIGRRLVHWSDVPSSDQPAIFQVQRHEDPMPHKRGLPTEWKLAADIYVYVNTGQDPHASPAIMLNPILDALDALFPASSENIQTLGGLVSHCWIAGRIETSEGSLGSQEVAIIPIEILAPI
jgi:hypothetical protein